MTGGAGYIGSHVLRAFDEAGIAVVALDSLVSGHREFVPGTIPFVHADVLDTGTVTQALRDHDVSGVVHLAGYKYAGESVRNPLLTYEQNVTGTAHLLTAMERVGVRNMVFSSSAAVYGTPRAGLVTEGTPTLPESPYGESKLIGEWLIRDQGRARGLRHTSLRYFNVVGSADPSVYDVSPHNLFPIVFEALIEGRTPKIFGDDYDTPDGTNVRDYVHVGDIAAAHVAAAQRLASGAPIEPAYNLGSGDGLSVKQIMDAVARVTGIDFTPEVGPRRPGDPDRIVATGELAARDLDWTMRYTVDEMVRTGWEARRAAG